MIPRKPHHKRLKRSRKPMKRGKLDPVGKKGRADAKARRINKQKLFEKGIDYCERCGTRICLSLSHRFKRRFITRFGELLIVCVLCFECHRYADQDLSHEQLLEFHNRILATRDLRETTGA